jgi:hypothetical protein
MSATADSSRGELSEAKHPATSDSPAARLVGIPLNVFHYNVTAELLKVAGFFASLRMTLWENSSFHISNRFLFQLQRLWAMVRR